MKYVFLLYLYSRKISWKYRGKKENVHTKTHFTENGIWKFIEYTCSIQYDRLNMFKMDSFLENKDFYRKKKKKLYATRYIFQLFLHIYIYIQNSICIKFLFLLYFFNFWYFTFLTINCNNLLQLNYSIPHTKSTHNNKKSFTHNETYPTITI